MNRMSLIALLFLLQVSCDSGSLFEEVDFNEGDKLVFKYMNADFITPEEDHAFHLKYGHFYISDVRGFSILKGLIKENTNRPTENSGFAYMITLVGKDKNYFLGTYDLQNEILFSNLYYTLKIEDLKKISDSFIQIEKYNIRFLTISSFKKGIELLKRSSFEIEHYEKIMASGILEFNGMTTIKTTREKFPNIEDLKSIEKKIEEDLSSYDLEYKLVEVSANRDSIEIQIASNTSLESSIHDDYVITKPYNETIDLFPIEAYNIGNVNLKALFEPNNIKYDLTK